MSRLLPDSVFSSHVFSHNLFLSNLESNPCPKIAPSRPRILQQKGHGVPLTGLSNRHVLLRRSEVKRALRKPSKLLEGLSSIDLREDSDLNMLGHDFICDDLSTECFSPAFTSRSSVSHGNSRLCLEADFHPTDSKNSLQIAVLAI